MSQAVKPIIRHPDPVEFLSDPGAVDRRPQQTGRLSKEGGAGSGAGLEADPTSLFWRFDRCLRKVTPWIAGLSVVYLAVQLIRWWR